MIAENRLSAQHPGIRVLEEGRKTSIRGLSVVSDELIWVSGSNGSVGKSTDGGKTWNWQTVAGYEKRDFRDIEAFDENTAVIMGIAEPAIILKTKDGGMTWYKVFEDSTKGMFLDAMHSLTEKGKTFMTVIGDPINGKAFFGVSYNNGDSWETNSGEPLSSSLAAGEAFFASSGTNIFTIPNNGGYKSQTYAVTGGEKSSLLALSSNLPKYPLPIIQGKNSTGANSIAFAPSDNPSSNPSMTRGIIVGGDFAQDSLADQNCVLIQFKKGMPVFTKPQTNPHGYRSCVIYLNKQQLITCGTSGVDISDDGGRNWTLISKDSYHVVQKAKNGSAVFLAGTKGRISILQ